MDVDALVSIASDSITQDLFDLSQKDLNDDLVSVRELSNSVKDMQDQALDSVLSNSLVGNQYVPPDTKTSKKEKARRRKAQAEKTAGKGWFDLPATEMTPEIKQDLKVLQMRNFIFKDKFYKKSDPLPKYFQVGHVVDNAADFYSTRTTKKQRGNTLVEELLRDSEFKKYTKNKFLEIQRNSSSGGKAFHRKKMNKRIPVWKRK